MQYQIKLNKQQGTITLKKVQRNIVLKQTGRRGPQGIPGAPASNLVTSVNGRIGDVVITPTDVGNITAQWNANEINGIPVINTDNIGMDDVLQYDADAGVFQPGSLPTKSSIGLGNVDNTHDLDKPISNDTQAALDLKEDVANKSDSTSLGSSTVLYPTQNAVKTYVDTAIGDIPGSPVISVNGQTGVVVLDSDDILDTSSTHKFVTAADIIKLSNLSGINTGDQDLSPYELLSNKSTSTSLGVSNTLYPTQAAVKSYVDSAVSGVPIGNYVLKSGDTMTGRLVLSTAVDQGIMFGPTGDGIIYLADSSGLRIHNDNAMSELRLVPSSTQIYFQNTISSGDIVFSGLNASALTGDVIFISEGTVRPYNNLAATLGAPAQYWSSVYGRRLNLNDSTYIDGDTAGVASVNGNIVVNGSGLFSNTVTVDNSATIRNITADTFSNGLMVNKRGTTGNSTAAVVSGSEVGYHTFSAWTGTQYRRMAYVIVYTSGNSTDTTGGGVYQISTRSGSGIEATRIQIDESGIIPAGNLIHNSGGDFNYYLNDYAQRRYFNSTAYMDGSVTGTINLGAGKIGILATSGSATHSLTIGSTATGIVSYNTSDQTTNYERIRYFWSGNTYNIVPETAGTGAVRDIVLGYDNGVRINAGDGNGFLQIVRFATGSSARLFNISGGLAGSVGTQYGASISPVISQTGSTAYTALLVNPTETSVGSGTKLLADFEIGGISYVSIGTNAATVGGRGFINVTNSSNDATGAGFNFSTNSAAWSGLFQLDSTGQMVFRNRANAGKFMYFDYNAAINFRSGTTSAVTTLSIDATGNQTIVEGGNLIFGSTTGTKIGTNANQKIGLWGKTPIVQPAAITDASLTLTSLQSQLNLLLAAQRAMGAIAT